MPFGILLSQGDSWGRQHLGEEREASFPSQSLNSQRSTQFSMIKLSNKNTEKERKEKNRWNKEKKKKHMREKISIYFQKMHWW